MQRLILIFLLAFMVCTIGVNAQQQLIIGERAPELKIGQYVSSTPIQSGRPTLVSFFYSPSKPCHDHLPILNQIALNNQGKLNVLLLARDSRDKIAPLVEGKGYAFSVALDDNNKTFTSHGVQFVPFSVLLDAKGRVLWFGNSSQLNQQVINSSLRW